MVFSHVHKFNIIEFVMKILKKKELKKRKIYKELKSTHN